VNNLPGQNADFLQGSTAQQNSFLQYVQSMSPETIAQLSRPVSSEVMQAMEHNIIGLLGGLPSQHFDITVTTSREDLGRLLASAMMSGYFLRSAEQRLAFEQSLSTDITQ
jgi:Protein of unknown function (DUF760)